ncbi:MAG TPA: glycosyltransferase family 4 protein [Anaeromyxobacteraceae bacterium]|nr:glycosyltransferase family 4 protein [Anaeromyxobacteraceae bacterium]
MKVLLLNQFFHPDVAPTGQMATELGEDLVRAGVDVTAVVSRGTYLGGVRLPRREEHAGIAIRRIPGTAFGKRSLLHRGLDYASFYASAATALARLPRHDVVIAMSTPPLIAAAGLAAKARRGSRLVYWVQDLYPAVAVAFGALREGSPVERAMREVSRQVMRHADQVVVLGQSMAERVADAGADPGRVRIIENWADGGKLCPVAHEENALRAEAAGDAAFVVMYSGNIGRAHDVETIARAARLLRDHREIRFVFQGDGAKRTEFEAATRGLENVRFAPYQPADRLAEALSAADAHLVTLAPAVAGMLEPSKLYSVMAVGRPALYVGPLHAEAARTVERERCGFAFRNGDASGLAEAIVGLSSDPARSADLGRLAREVFVARYDRQIRTAQFARMLRELP